jgi:hypothetical protein
VDQEQKRLRRIEKLWNTLPTNSITTKKNLSHVSVHEGLCPNIYSDFNDDKHQSRPDEKKGMIMCDELKFKTQLYWNTTSDKLVGFATESGNMVNLKDEVGSLFNSTNNDDTKNTDANKNNNKCDDTKLAVYVNQWRWRSVYNETRNLEFFYNSGSLSANEVLHQMFHVMSNLKM